MTTTSQKIRLSIFNLLEQVDDKSLLTSFHDLLTNIVSSQQKQGSKIAGYSIQGKEITVTLLEELLLRRDASIQAGNFLTNEEMNSKFQAYRQQKTLESL